MFPDVAPGSRLMTNARIIFYHVMHQRSPRLVLKCYKVTRLQSNVWPISLKPYPMASLRTVADLTGSFAALHKSKELIIESNDFKLINCYKMP